MQKKLPRSKSHFFAVRNLLKVCKNLNKFKYEALAVKVKSSDLYNNILTHITASCPRECVQGLCSSISNARFMQYHILNDAVRLSDYLLSNYVVLSNAF